MSYSVEIDRKAFKAIAALPRAVAARVKDAIDALADDPTPHGSKPLQGERNTYRIRVGDYRIVYTLDRGKLVVVVVKVANRREVYR